MKKEKMIKGTFGAEVKAFNDEDLTIEHFISTELKDRGGDIMMADGMKVKGRVVVLMAHGYSQLGTEPIAKPVKLSRDEFKGRKGILAKTQFYDGSHLTPPDSTGRRLYEKAKEGYMPNWSIGYIPIKWEFEKYGTNRDEIRRVIEWELLEYSPVGVPMNPDAQCVEKCGKCKKETWFKILPEGTEDKQYVPVDGESLWDEKVDDPVDEEKEYGPLVTYDKDGGLLDGEGKPYPNEHACRVNDPGKYDRIRRQNDKFGKGIHAIWGIKDNKAELQAIRFSSDKFTAAEARKWCSDHDYSCRPFEAASGKEDEERLTKLEKDLATALTLLGETNARIVEIVGRMDEMAKASKPSEPTPPAPADNPSADTPRPKLLVIEDNGARDEQIRTLVTDTVKEEMTVQLAAMVKKLSGKID